MTAGTVICWRHGRTAYNASTRMQGTIDIPLDEIGQWQVEQAALDLWRRHAPTRIVASDLGRARATAQQLADLVGLQVGVDTRLRERSFGEWEGLTAEEIAEQWPEEFAVWQRGGDPKRMGAESRAAVAERFSAAVRELAAPMAHDETLVLVSHGAAVSLGLTALLGLDAVAWRGLVGLHNAHWSVLRASRGDAWPAWRMEAHNVGPSVVVADWNAGVPAENLPSSAADAMRG
ncbi:histidine phosphatase family protein [Actinotalea fermentans]|uniref:Phosphoglycerate mutase n=1 Tax=Actinotalea fermentans TaxID=43671 RepID=A0A511YTI5_9CELL|nr:histidine phosphatase family protein [Actinotalea fermentans]KGM14812.1 phosphoglycerate mutase [Actinotalea fermentans ATCC 43279 = JCM 9966 = DSM 3133]GEN78510.1 phosphoglycerate mutase [Actinotalea fermentans]